MIPVAQRDRQGGYCGCRRSTAPLRWLACARGHRLVLVYHRLGPPVADGCEVVPSVPVESVQGAPSGARRGCRPRHHRMRCSHGRAAGATAGGSRPAVAVTFDDDLPSHAAACASSSAGTGRSRRLLFVGTRAARPWTLLVPAARGASRRSRRSAYGGAPRSARKQNRRSGLVR